MELENFNCDRMVVVTERILTGMKWNAERASENDDNVERQFELLDQVNKVPQFQAELTVQWTRWSRPPIWADAQHNKLILMSRTSLVRRKNLQLDNACRLSLTTHNCFSLLFLVSDMSSPEWNHQTWVSPLSTLISNAYPQADNGTIQRHRPWKSWYVSHYTG